MRTILLWNIELQIYIYLVLRAIDGFLVLKIKKYTICFEF